MNDLHEHWMQAWEPALAAWSRFTRLRSPRLCASDEEARAEGLSDSFAMIRLDDQSVVINLAAVQRLGVQDYAVEVLAHEIGHHVLAPASLTDHARLIGCLRPGLPGQEAHAAMVANLYTDLLINDRLQRSTGLRMAALMGQLQGPVQGQTWQFYLRLYERLWRLDRGTLVAAETSDALEGDAWLGARLLRAFAHDWLAGAGRFAALLLPYLQADAQARGDFVHLMDTQGAAGAGLPGGMADFRPDRLSPVIHPAHDPALSGVDEPPEAPASEQAATGDPGAGQQYQPFEYGEVLRAAGVTLDDQDIAIQFYRERALPHLVRFPRTRTQAVSDPLPEGLEPWDSGESLDTLDWLQSLLVSPRLFPGLTTTKRVWGESEGSEPAWQALDLDLYVDCSGSMPNPQRLVSYTTLAGAILCISALRAGARVQVTLWSGKQQFISTAGFVNQERPALAVLTGYLGGGTAFPIHLLRETWATPRARPAHIVVLSDDGITTLFDTDERGNSGWAVSQQALANARGGGSLVLQIPPDWEEHAKRGHGWLAPLACLITARDQFGWALHPVADWQQLVDFARAFSRRHYLPHPQETAA